MTGRAEVEALNREAIGLILMKVAIFTLSNCKFLLNPDPHLVHLLKEEENVKSMENQLPSQTHAERSTHHRQLTSDLPTTPTQCGLGQVLPLPNPCLLSRGDQRYGKKKGRPYFIFGSQIWSDQRVDSTSIRGPPTPLRHRQQFSKSPSAKLLLLCDTIRKVSTC
jgi:hypothetical protein